MVALRCMIVTVLALIAMMLAPGVRAQAPEDLPAPHIRIELVPETNVPSAGSEVALALVSTPQPGWHGYWKNGGDAGIETTLAWTLPAGVSAGPLLYPVPHRLVIGGLMNYVYEGPFTQFAVLKIPAGLAAGTRLPVKVKVDYLVCTNRICVPEAAELSTELTVGDGAVPADRAAQFLRWRQALPQAGAGKPVFAVTEGAEKRFRLAVPVPAAVPAEDPYFFPIVHGAIDYAAPQTVTRVGDTMVIETKAAGSPKAVEGVLALGEGRGVAVSAVPGEVPTAGAAPGGASEGWVQAALIAFGGAVLGGLLLNIMPCVFPILSLKALSLAKANHGDARPRAEALAYTAGVVLVCLALGGILLAIRAAGASAGWAFQLQDPRVILVLLLLVMGIGFNLAGLFELSTPGVVNRAAAAGTGGAFMTGALAAFIATPCTGPFMGAALGAALVLPWGAALAVFGGLGLGLALPFLLLGFVPALRRMLPKPGAWMNGFKHILAIPMFLTGIALAWVLGRQIGIDGLAIALCVVLGLCVVLWAGGRRQARGLGFGLVAWIVVLGIAGAGVWLVSRYPVGAGAAEREVAGGAEPFSEARLAELRQQGRPVFAYFTADWCVTCKVNEKAVIETAATQKALADGKVAVLVGDWTDGDATLGRFIEKHNRAGVPLYLWYVPGEAEPRVLPQLLTQAMLADLAKPGA